MFEWCEWLLGKVPRVSVSARLSALEEDADELVMVLAPPPPRLLRSVSEDCLAASGDAELNRTGELLLRKLGKSSAEKMDELEVVWCCLAAPEAWSSLEAERTIEESPMEVEEELDAELEVREGRDEAPTTTGLAVVVVVVNLAGDLTTSKLLPSISLTRSSTMKLSSNEAWFCCCCCCCCMALAQAADKSELKLAPPCELKVDEESDSLDSSTLMLLLVKFMSAAGLCSWL